jgi:hypothetical protein
MLDMFFSFPLNFFLGLFAIIIGFIGIQLLMRESPNPTFTYKDSFDFFNNVVNIIVIIGVIATIISLSPLFLTFILGEDWLHILLTTPLGILALGAIIIATYFAAFLIYCLLALIILRWIHQILQNNEIRLSDKIISFTILLSGVIAISCIVLFLFTIWFSRINTAISITGIGIYALITGFAFFILVGVLIDIYCTIPNYSIRIVSSLIIIISIFAVVGMVIYPAINDGDTIYKIASNYSAPEKFNFSFQPMKMKINNTPIIISVQPNFTDYPKNSINLEYINCHWSTNYGYFFTINTESLLIQKKSNEFTIPKCIQDQKNDVYWTYEISDYLKNKPAVIVSLQIENSNKKSASDNLGENAGRAVDYIVGSAHSNFTWSNLNDISIENSSFFSLKTPFFTFYS